MMVDIRRMVTVEMKRNEQIQVIFWRWRHEDWLMDRNEGKRGMKDTYVSIYEYV